MEGEAGNLQNEFFNSARKERRIVALFLMSGKKLVGRVRSFDRFTVLVEVQGGELMVFKHAIAAVSVSPDVSI